MTKIFTLIFILSFSFQLASQDTFSIIAVDSLTGEIGAAGATCVDGIAQFGGIQVLNKIIPGRGGVNAQAWICLNPHINLDNAIDQMEGGLSPQEIINWLIANDACNAQNFNPEYRQYGIVDFDGSGSPRTASFTGTNADDYKGHRVGPNYAIQGNILLGPEVLDQMEAGFNNTNGSLAEKLMAAMQGANIPGADSRCLARGTSSTSAFLRVYKSDDAINSPSLELSILEMPFGQEPIDSLQVLFDAWVLSTSTPSIFNNNVQLNIFPNPAQDFLTVSFDTKKEINVNLEIINIAGQSMLKSDIQKSNGWNKKYNIKNFPEGIYFLTLSTEKESIILKFIKTRS